MSESKLLREIMLAAPDLGCRLLRNNVGVLRDIYGNYVRYGLGVGSSDCVGWTERTITRGMVGQKVAVFTAIETKRPGWNPPKSGKKLVEWEKQKNFLIAVKNAGGIAELATDADDFRRAITASPPYED